MLMWFLFFTCCATEPFPFFGRNKLNKHVLIGLTTLGVSVYPSRMALCTLAPLRCIRQAHVGESSITRDSCRQVSVDVVIFVYISEQTFADCVWRKKKSARKSRCKTNSWWKNTKIAIDTNLSMSSHANWIERAALSASGCAGARR